MTNKEAIKILKNSGIIYSKGNYTPDDLELAIDLAIKALENEPKKGKWIDGFCNICDCACKSDGWGREIETNFCPNCGADMREADNDN